MNKKEDFNKIYVLGTGLSSLVSILFLVSKGIKPTVIDIGKKYNSSNYKVPIFQPYFYRNKIDDVSFFGGLSNVWKGVVKFTTKNEFEELDIDNPEELFKELLEYLDNLYFFSNVEVKPNLFELKNINSINIVIENYLNKFNEMHQSLVMSSSKQNCEPYNTTYKINDLIKKKKINFIKGKVLSIKSINNEKFIEYLSNDKLFLETYDYIFCGAGTVSSTKIIKDSLKFLDEPKFKFSQKWLLLSLYREKKLTNNTFPLYQGAMAENNKTKIYIQSSLLSQLLISKFHGFLKKLFTIFLKLPLFNYISISYISISEEKKGNSIINKSFFNLKDILSLVNKINNFQHLFKVFPIGIKLPKLGGGHFGSTFPFKKKNNLILEDKNVVYSDKYGSIKDVENFSVIDSTTLSNIHVVPPTLNVMLHSLNLTKKVYNTILKKN